MAGPINASSSPLVTEFSALCAQKNSHSHGIVTIQPQFSWSLGEFDYRFSTCDMTDSERMADLAGRVAGRLSYEMVTA